MSLITVDELKAKMDNGKSFVLLDVREPDEYAIFNIGAINYPLSSFHLKMEEMMQYADREIIVHCKVGGRSFAAQQALLKAGFKNVLNLVGGLTAYKARYGTSTLP